MRNANSQRLNSMIPVPALHQLPSPHVSHAEIEGSRRATSGRPALRLAHHEIPEHLHARHRLQFLGINEIGIELN
jgi:hypothetical protein